MTQAESREALHAAGKRTDAYEFDGRPAYECEVLQIRIDVIWLSAAA